jgi:hypothetical protein
VGLQFGAGALQHHFAGFEDIGTVGQAQRHRGVLLDQQHGHAHGLDARQCLRHFGHDLRRQAE